MHTNQLQVEFWGHLNFLRAEAGGPLVSRYYGMLHIAPDIGDAVCPGENTWYREMPMYVYEFFVFDIMVCIQGFYFDVRIWILWLRYRTRHRRNERHFWPPRYRWSKSVGLEPPPNIVPDIEVLTLMSKSWLRYRMWQRASDWSLLQISYPISKFFTSISKSCLRYRSLWVPYIVKSSKNDFDIEVKNFDIEI
jgi:hypothetical protein